MELYLAAIIQGLCYTSLGLGVYLSLRIFRIPDITTDGSFTLGGAVAAVCLINGWNVWITMTAAITAGMVGGTITGIIATKIRVHPLLAGILVMTALYSINLVIMGRSNMPIETETGLLDTTGDTLLQPLLVALVFGISLLLLIAWLLKTDLGIAMRATGNNEQMAAANGVHVNRMKILGLSLANGLTAISGFLMVQYQGFADINMGVGIIIAGLAAVMVGEAIGALLNIRKLWMILASIAVGSILFRLAIAQSLVLGLNPNYLKLVTAMIVLAIVVGSNAKSKKA